MAKPARTSVAAVVLFAVVLAEVAATAVAGALSRLSAAQLVDGFAVSNAVIGFSLAGAGWPIARHRPGNPIGWLMLAAGAAYGTSSAGYALLAAGTHPGDSAPGWRLLALVTNGAWTLALGILLPLAVLIFPDGRLPGRRWRWVVVLAAANTVLFLAMGIVPRGTLSDSLGVRGYLTDPGLRPTSSVGAVSVVLTTVVYGAVLGGLVVHYRRGDERIRRQLLWLVLAGLIIVCEPIAESLLGVETWVAIYMITLIPAAVVIAILRYQLLDIRLVVSRSLLYMLLTAAIVASYAGLVAGLDAVLQVRVGLGSSVVATLLIAGAFNPVRLWLQRRIDRVFYGARRDPVRAMTEVGARLGEISGDGGTGLAGVLEVLCQVMRLPSASVVVEGQEFAAFGTAPPVRQSIPLRQGGQALGELTIGLRSGESRLAPADEKVIGLLCVPLAVAVHAMSLAAELSRSRGNLVSAREEERRRLRRDLHDGLGSALTGVVLKADAARRLAGPESGQVGQLLTELRTQTTEAVADIRRLVNELRPATLDSLGLLDALRGQAELLSRRADGPPLRVNVLADEPSPALPPAAEVAAYRIVTEALTNVARHSAASAVTVRVRTDLAELALIVQDNGGAADPWVAGVGLTSMRERASELGGTCHAGPTQDGGLVRVIIPLSDRSLPGDRSLTAGSSR